MENLTSALREAAEQTFDTLCFMLPEETDERLAEELEAAAWVQFTGPVNGHLALWLHGSLQATLVGNMLGTEEALPAEDLDDGLKEIVNVICGNVLTAILGTDAVFDMTPPEMIDPTSGSMPQTGSQQARVKIRYPDGWAEVAFYTLAPAMESC